MPPPPEEGKFRFIGERERLAGSFIRLVTGTFVDPEGFTFEREIVRHLGAVCVVPLEDDGRHVLLVRQYRVALDRYVLEVPAGKRDVLDEPEELTARRELKEEAGCEATRMTNLGKFWNSPGFTDEETTCFLAEDLVEVSQSPQGVEENYLTIERVELDEIFALVARGEVVDAKTIIAIALATRLLAERTISR